MNKVNFFLAGCQKTGSTWLYECLKEHPEVFVPKKDALHYFTINHFRGNSWYENWFHDQQKEKVICDPTPSYIRSGLAAHRIKSYNPEAKLLFILRNPIERSFSHYWHQKRKKKVSYSFDAPFNYNEVGNYDMYDMWINSSMYYSQLLPYFEVFDEKQIKVFLYDDLKLDSNKFLKDVFTFLNVDPSFVPNMANKKVNNAPIAKQSTISRKQMTWLDKAKNHLFSQKMTSEFKATDEYSTGISKEYRDQLSEIFNTEINNLSKLIKKDLSHWK